DGSREGGTGARLLGAGSQRVRARVTHRSVLRRCVADYDFVEPLSDGALPFGPLLAAVGDALAITPSDRDEYLRAPAARVRGCHRPPTRCSRQKLPRAWSHWPALVEVAPPVAPLRPRIYSRRWSTTGPRARRCLRESSASRQRTVTPTTIATWSAAWPRAGIVD